MSLDTLLASHTEPRAWWQACVDVYRQEAEFADDTQAALLLVEAGRILAEQLGLAFEAQAAFDAAEARAPGLALPAVWGAPWTAYFNAICIGLGLVLALAVLG